MPLVVLNMTFRIVRHEFSEGAHVDRLIQKNKKANCHSCTLQSTILLIFLWDLNKCVRCSHFYDYCDVKANLEQIFTVATDVLLLLMMIMMMMDVARELSCLFFVNRSLKLYFVLKYIITEVKNTKPNQTICKQLEQFSRQTLEFI